MYARMYACMHCMYVYTIFSHIHTYIQTQFRDNARHLLLMISDAPVDHLFAFQKSIKDSVLFKTKGIRPVEPQVTSPGSKRRPFSAISPTAKRHKVHICIFMCMRMCICICNHIPWEQTSPVFGHFTNGETPQGAYDVYVYVYLYVYVYVYVYLYVFMCICMCMYT